MKEHKPCRTAEIEDDEKIKTMKGMKKMRKMRKAIMAAAMAVILGMSSLLTGCGTGIPGIHTEDVDASGKNPQSVSLVLGVHRFFPLITLNRKEIYARIYEACYTYGSVSAVTVDGEPFVSCNYDINKPDKKINEAKKKQLAKGSAEQIMAAASSTGARTPEIDTLSAITLSADTLQSTKEESEKSMIIFDSGLSTASYLNFADQALIEEPVDSIVTQLEELHAIPDLEGIEVTWFGIGQTCGEQTGLTTDYKYKLRNIWQAILEKGGAKSVDFDPSPVSAEESAMELPECSTVAVVTDGLDVTGEATEKGMPKIVRWDEKSPVNFRKEQAEFTDPLAAAEQMKPVVAYLAANPDEKVYIFGMTATVYEGDLGISLSRARANACKDILIQQGVPESQLAAGGLGQRANSLRVNDVDANGVQIEEQAQKNRAVFIIRGDSEVVEELMRCAGEMG